ncbi:catalase [Coprinopsis cinerea okayama7|uniref:Catalase n=1 Tax=Coprinopsis cinerea (strain Okayama-7 / 130 / ATCC MYA-4618 / FGSC 9003) TaxID=240176 RepID=A8NH39_COPC7|nr:catalase [Coprinopsis cinerea okayama7\|eukprot:XP_001833673.2 catalase [Coprinopsis cinerea okayama7\
MSSIGSTLKHAMNTVVGDAKTRDLQRDTVVPTRNSAMTTDYGAKMSDTDHWLSVSDGSKVGPALLEDQIAREKIHRFDHERIPERVVHARGTGAHGEFRVFDHRASKYTSAPVLTDPSRTTPIFIRFSTVQGSRGSADCVRDVRGFAVKFYTPEGNWDLVANDIPVFFIQDAIKFPDFVHAVKPEPQNEVPQGQSAHNNFWDFVGLQPESAHMVMWTMSDRGIPRSYRMMQGFGVNTFTLINAKGERHFVKFHMTPELGVHSLVWDEALKINGQDPDFHRKDLAEAIHAGCYPKWTFGIQVIPEKDEHNFDFDILDATKIWPEELVPLQPIGELVLNRTVDEYFPEVEQVAFCTSHVVPGIGFSDDPLLQGRNFSYFDTQISRLGINWEQLPINRPVCPVMNINRDGKMQMRIHKTNLNYFPNRDSIVNPVPPAEGGYVEFMEKIVGLKQRVRGAKFQEHYNQAQLFWNSLTPWEKEHTINAFAFELSHCDDQRVYERYTTILNNVDFELAKAVAIKVNGVVPEKPARPNHGRSSAPLSQFYYAPKKPIIATRRIAIIVADGFHEAEVLAVRSLLASAKATTWIIGPRRAAVKAAGGGRLVADHSLEDQRSTLFDAVYIPSGEEHAKTLIGNGRAIHWIREAFGHCKAIGAVGEGVSVVNHALNLPEVKLFTAPNDDTVLTSYGVVTTGKYGVKSAATDVLQIEPGPKGFVSNFAYEISKHRCFERELDGLTAKVAY